MKAKEDFFNAAIISYGNTKNVNPEDSINSDNILPLYFTSLENMYIPDIPYI